MVFFTETDPIGQLLYGIDIRQLALNIKLWILLCDHVVVPASHIFESSTTYDLLRSCPALLESSVVVPNLRVGCRDYRDYVELKLLQERDPGFIIQGDKLKEIAAFLDSAVPTVATWEAKDTRRRYLQTLLGDLCDGSPLRRKLKGEKKLSLERFTKALAEVSEIEISRQKVFQLADEHLARRRDVMKKHANLLYYLSGASILDHVLHPTALELARARYTPIASAINLRLGEETLFTRYLEYTGLSRHLVSPISIADLLDLRNTSEGRAFRKAWQKVIGAKPRPSTTNAGLDSTGSFATLEDLLQTIIRREYKRQDVVKQVRTSLSIASFVFGVVTGAVSNPILGLAGLGVGLITLDPLIDKVVECSGAFDFTLFASRLQRLAVKVLTNAERA
jgi:hypothetical protein